MSLNDLEIPHQISAEMPSGPNLEYDAAFLGLEREVRKGNWSAVKDQAISVCGRTQDIRVGIHLAHALLMTEGFPGLSKGLSIICTWLESSWVTVHPQIEAAPIERANAVSNLCEDVFLYHLRRTGLVDSTQFGKITGRMIRIAGKESGYSPETDQDGNPEAAPDLSQIESSFKRANPARLRVVWEAVQTAISHVQAIVKTFVERASPENRPDLSALSRELERSKKDLEKFGGNIAPGPSATGASEAGAASASAVPDSRPSGSGDLNSPQDVVSMLDRICSYYEIREPSSPIPPILRRVQRLVSRSFLEIINDLSPDALPQLEGLLGSKLKKEGESDAEKLSGG